MIFDKRRFVGETLRITFADGPSALEAVKLSGREIDGEPIEITLKTVEWHKIIEATQALCKSNTIPLNKVRKEKTCTSACS